MRNAAAVVLVLGLAWCMACSSSSSSSTTDAGVRDASADGSLQNTFGTSACATCVNQACQQAESNCASDAACATYLACLNACPTDASGNVQPSCESSCTLPTAAASAALAGTYDTCRISGPGDMCTACGTDGSTTPIVEAGPDVSYINEQCNPSMADDSSACNYCQTTQCCQTYTALNNDSNDFESMANCALGCAADAGSMEPSCLKACFTEYPQALALYAPFQACENVNCYSVCDGPPTACDVCRDTSCRVPYAECEGDPDCFAILFCAGNSLPSAQGACASEWPNGQAKLNNFLTCAVANCKSPCSL